MAVSYAEFNVEDISLRNFQKYDCSWSEVNSILAIVVFSPSVGGTVKLLNENGLPLLEEVHMAGVIPIKPGLRVSSISWHPRCLTLSVSWENGDLGCFSVKPTGSKWVYASTTEDILACTRAITMNKWNMEGDILITGILIFRSVFNGYFIF